MVDDVWRSSDLEPLRAEDSPRSRLLFTTRDASIAAAMGAREHVADLLTDEQSREVLARWSRTEIANLPPMAAQLIHECGRLPLALSMVGAMLRGKPATYWNAVLEHLRNADLDKIKAQFPDYPYTDVLRAIQVSVDSLDETSRARYLALAVLLEEMAAAPPVQQCLWGVDENRGSRNRGTVCQSVVSAARPARRQYSPPRPATGLRACAVPERRQGSSGADPRRGSALVACDWQRSRASSPRRWWDGCCRTRTCPLLHSSCKRVAEGTRTPWLRPLQPALHPPGTSLIRTLAGHSDAVSGVALSGDGRLAVSASADKTLKVWEVESGRELRTLAGHSDSVHGVAVSGDGRLAVSASDDNTLKVWDLESGRELRTLHGHTGAVTGVAVSGDGRLAVSASADNTLKVWEVESGRELRTLEGHTVHVTGVALSGDGRLAVSASEDKTLKVWDVESGRELRTLAGHTDPVYGVAVSADGRLAVSASDDKTLKVWDVESGRELRTLTGHSDRVLGVALSGDGRLAVSASRGQNAEGVGCGERARTAHPRRPLGVCQWRGGDARTGGARFPRLDDQTLKVWELDSGRELRTLAGHSDHVTGGGGDGGRAARGLGV